MGLYFLLLYAWFERLIPVLLRTPEQAATLFLLSSKDLDLAGNEDTQFPVPDSFESYLQVWSTALNSMMM